MRHNFFRFKDAFDKTSARFFFASSRLVSKSSIRPHPPIKLKTLTGAVSTCMEEMMERLRRYSMAKALSLLCSWSVKEEDLSDARAHKSSSLSLSKMAINRLSLKSKESSLHSPLPVIWPEPILGCGPPPSPSSKHLGPPSLPMLPTKVKMNTDAKITIAQTAEKQTPSGELRSRSACLTPPIPISFYRALCPMPPTCAHLYLPQHPPHHWLVGAQPPPCCSFARHLVGKMVIHCSFAHH